MFPLLKLEFSPKPHISGGTSPEKRPVSPKVKQSRECRTMHTKGEVSITPHMSVSDLKEIFSDTFGLTVKVFHKSDGAWLEIATNMLSLEKQNAAVPEIKSL